MEDTLVRIEGVFTYTYDQFTVFFYGDHVFIGGKEYPLGQCVVDIMNLGPHPYQLSTNLGSAAVQHFRSLFVPEGHRL